MDRIRHWRLIACITVVTTLGAWGCTSNAERPPLAAAQQSEGEVPQFEWDPTWPKQPFPNNWILGMVIGLAVDPDDHVWISHRPRSVTPFEGAAGADPPTALCCVPAPPVIEFDPEGNIVQAWGGPGSGYEWPAGEHGLRIDHDRNVWIGGAEGPDAQFLKFTPDGSFLLQIGNSGQSQGSNDLQNLGRPADAAVDQATNEVWIADGYANRRVIVFDAATGAYKRHFGAYGNTPEDTPYSWDHRSGTPPPQQFGLVHCVEFSNDGLVYVCDRSNNRIQVFRKDGTFVREKIVTPDVLGAVANDVAFSPDPEQRFMYVVDHASSKVWILTREDLEVVGSFGYGGHFGGGLTIAHDAAVDSSGNLYITEGLEGKRVQRFLYRGMGPGE